MNDESVFAAAVEKRDPAERQAFLDQVCAGDAEQRRRVELLLAADARSAGILEREPAGPGATNFYQTIAERPGTVIGPYKLLQQIGEGGMGAVFMAEQTRPVQRRVALKIIKPGMDSSQVIARFEAERQALAMMDHQNIARVLDAGTTEGGRPYFVMELVHGVPITQFCDDRKLTPRQRLELFVPVCQALQHAHQKGIIHRDIKPSNVLVTMYDDRPVPKVIDFGVAKAIEQRLTERTMFTQYGTLVGTFEYMSPEQAEMNAFGVDTRSDIYSLGVLLYELLTGATPLDKKRLHEAALDELVRLIKQEEAPRPSVRLSSSHKLPKIAAARNTEPTRLSGLVRGEVDWIVMKCLEKDRTRRYESAGSLARDIERHLADEPVEACPPSAAYRFQKFARKYRRPLQVAGAFLCLLVAAVIVSTWQAVRATVAEGVAEERKREADDAREQAEKRGGELADLNGTLRRARYIADMNLAHHAWADNNQIRTRELLELHRPRPGQPDLRGFEWHYLRRLFQGAHKAIQAHAGTVSAIGFASAGQRLFSCGRSRPLRGIVVEQDFPGEIRLWDVATGRQLPLGLKATGAKAQWVAVSPDGARLAAACGDQGIWIWNLATGEPTTLERRPKELDVALDFSPDGKRLVSMSVPEDDNSTTGDGTTRGGRTRIWDLAARKVVATIEKRPPWNPPQFSPDGKLLAVAEYRRSVVSVFDAKTGREVFSCTYRDGLVTHAVFSPDGKRLAACGEGGVQLWDVSSHAALGTWPSTTNLGMFLAYSPEGNRLALGTIEGAVELWDTGTGRKIRTFNGHTGSIAMVVFSPNGQQLASAGRDGTVRLWDPRERRGILALSPAGVDAGYWELSPDGRTVLEGDSSAKRVQFRDAATGQPRGPAHLLAKSPLDPLSKAWTADGKRFFTLEGSNQIKELDVATGKLVRTIPLAGAEAGALAVSADGKWFAHPGPGGTIGVRDALTGAVSRIHPRFTSPIHFLLFSPDGSRLLGLDVSGQMQLWDRATCREIAATRLRNLFVVNVRFSPNGKRLAVVGSHNQSLVGEVRVLDGESGREMLALKGHTVNVLDASFCSDGQRLATCGSDRTIRLWDLTTGQEILTLRGHSRPVYGVRFISDGHRLISVSADRTVRTWDATPLPE